MNNGAFIDGDYRYLLWRRVGPGAGRLLFVMLNPSTADASEDDPTIRRCIGFARRERFGWLDVVNLYALRATDPDQLWTVPDPIGPKCDEFISERARAAGCIVAAWGATLGPGGRARIDRVRRLLGPMVRCLGTTKDGSPRHPLYVRGDAPMAVWP